MAHVVLTACGVTTTTIGTGTVDIIDTAPTGYGILQTIADALGDSEIASGDTVDYHILDADGAGWESGRGIITNAAPDTLARTTIYRSSAASDAAITLSSGTHTILFSPSSKALTAPRGHIEFDSPAYMTYSSAAVTTVTVAAGRGWIDDEYLSWTTGEASGTVTLTENGGLMYVYLYNNSGTVDQETSATAPVWSSALGFWVKTGSTTHRCIGWILAWEPTTSGTERILPYVASMSGRRATIAYSLDDDGTDDFSLPDFQVVTSSGNTTDISYTSFALEGRTGTPLAGVEFVPSAMIAEWCLSAKMNNEVGSSDDGILTINPVAVNAALDLNDGYYTVRAEPSRTATGRTFFGRHWIPYAGSDPYYALLHNSGTIGVEIECFGGAFQI